MPHAGSPLMAEWHAAHREELQLPPLHDLDDVVAACKRAGFDASVARLALRFVPCGEGDHHEAGRVLDWLTYYSDHKLLLRFARPRSG